MKNILLFLLVTSCTLSVYSQNKTTYSTDTVEVKSSVEFFIYDGPYGEKENIKEPAIKFILSIKNLGTKAIPDIDVSNRSQYVNLFINDTLNNPLSLYNGVEMLGDHLLNKGDSDEYVWWIFESYAYSDIFTVQWQYMNLYSEKFKVNMTRKTIEQLVL
jgi:hypothetical protein